MKLKTTLTALFILFMLALTSCMSNTETSVGTDTPSTNPVVEEATSSPLEMDSATPVDVPTQEEKAATSPTEETAQEESATTRPANWTEETHSKETDPNYDVVFPQEEVNRLDITVTAETWQAMLADLDTLYGSNNSTGGRGGRGGGNDVGALEGDDTNPMWVTATIEFEGVVWENVGLRFKGNSSLSSTWRNGGSKFPLKLDFDEFEDDYPEIDDQRFYGFKQLSLSSNFSDNSLLREKVAADIFRESGVPAAQTAFYEVYLDNGTGSTYLGLYTMVEVIDDTLIETQFDDDDGNVYKPSGNGATFATNSFSEESFDKETNQDEADYSDILALYDALHSETRTTNSESWRAELEICFRC